MSQMSNIEKLAHKAIEAVTDHKVLGRETAARLGRPRMGEDDSEWYAMQDVILKEVLTYAPSLIKSAASQ